MNINKLLYIGCIAVSVAFLAGCDDRYSGDTYTTANANEVQRAEVGTVLQIREVKIMNENLNQNVGAGTAAGAIGGSLVGAHIGGKSHAATATLGGMAVGAAVGGLATAAFSDKGAKATEYVVQLDNGGVRVLAQSGPVIQPGTRVLLITSIRSHSDRGSKCRITPLQQQN